MFYSVRFSSWYRAGCPWGCPADSPRLLHPEFWERGGTGDPERRLNSERSPCKSVGSACRARCLWRRPHGPAKGQGWATVGMAGRGPAPLGTDLEGIVGRAAGPPPAPVLQLHLRVELLLVLLHDVRQVGPPAALRVVLVSVATVRLGRRRGCRWRGSSSVREYPGPLLAGPPLLCPLLSSESRLGVWVRAAHLRGEAIVVPKPAASCDGRERTRPGLPTRNPDGGRQRPLGLLAGQNARGLTRHTGKHHFSGYRQPLQLSGWTKAQATGRKLRWQQDSRPREHVRCI